MQPDTFEGEINAIADPQIATAHLIDRLASLSGDVGRKDQEARNGAGAPPEIFVFILRELIEQLPRLRLASHCESRPDTVAGQAILAEVRAMMQVHARGRVGQTKITTARQRLAPQEFVVSSKRRAEEIRIPARGELGSEI